MTCAGSKSGLALCKCCLCQIRLTPVIITAVASRTFRRLTVQVLPLSLRQPGCPVPNCCNYYSALVRRPSQRNETERKLYLSEPGLLIHIGCTKMLEQFSAGVNFPQQNNAKRSYQHRPMYRVTAPTSAHLSPVYLCLWRHLNTVVYSAASATDDTSRTHFSCLSDRSLAPRDL